MNTTGYTPNIHQSSRGTRCPTTKMAGILARIASTVVGNVINHNGSWGLYDGLGDPTGFPAILCFTTTRAAQTTPQVSPGVAPQHPNVCAPVATAPEKHEQETTAPPRQATGQLILGTHMRDDYADSSPTRRLSPRFSRYA